jgi:CRISPR-associated protein Cmr2
MIADYLAKNIIEHQGKLDTLAKSDDSSVSGAAFYYLEATCQEEWNKKQPDEFRGQWHPRVNEYGLREMAKICEQPDTQLDQMPLLSIHLAFKFTLNKPFLSRDDNPFHIIDNPVKKDKVFKLPYVSPSSYKGALRSAARYSCETPPSDFDPPIIERLFGTDKRRETESLKQGRLHFFPTFFSSIRLEIINPHDRKSGAGTLPIQFETAHGEGLFNLLYFPFDFDQSPQSYSEVADDLILIVKAAREMFTVYGFGAKTSSGFGIADVIKEGKLRVRFDDVPETKPTAGQQRPDDLSEFFTPEGVLKKFTESEMSKWGKPRRQRYEKARKWLERTQAESVAASEILPVPTKTITERVVRGWQGLIDTAEELAGRLRVKGGEKG